MLQVTYRYPQDSHHNLGNTITPLKGRSLKKQGYVVGTGTINFHIVLVAVCIADKSNQLRISFDSYFNTLGELILEGHSPNPFSIGEIW